MRISGITVPLYLLIFILLITGFAKADMPDGHKPVPCIGCHQEGINAYVGECDNCHDYTLNGNGLNVPLLESRHNPKICTACHMGNSLINATTREIFHNGHSAVNCNRCHTEDNFTVIKIKSDGFRCTYCHGIDIHSIHVKNLPKACPICHGSWAAGKSYQGKESPSSDMSEKKEKYEGFTAFYFIKSLINALLGIK
jgi:hypothetical protein